MQNILPDIFYYTEKQSKVKFSSIPTGAPNVDMLIAGLPPFPMPNPASETKLKKLVIANWINFLDLGYSDESTDESTDVAIRHMGDQLQYVKDFLMDVSELVDLSFYQWKSGKVTPIDSKRSLQKIFNPDWNDAEHKAFLDAFKSGMYKDNRDEFGRLLKNIVNITPVEEILLAAYEQQGISRDQILIVDMALINQIYDNVWDNRYLTLSQIAPLIPGVIVDNNIDSVVKLIKSAIPKLDKIIIDNNCCDFNLIDIALRDRLIDAFAEDDTIVVGIGEKLKNLYLPDINISSESLMKILQTASPLLKGIELARCLSGNESHKPLTIKPGSLSMLESLNLWNSRISLASFINILNAAQNLDFLSISLCTNLQGSSLIDINSLQKLERIYVEGCNLSEANMRILQSAPKLSQSSKEAINAWFVKHYRNISSQAEIQTPQPLIESKDNSPFIMHKKHNPAEMMDFQPQKSPFEFKNKNKTKNQGMIIEKFCQYLVIEDTHLELISRIQDGMCLALSNYFKDIGKISWDNFIDKSLSWNGKDRLDDELIKHFEELLTYVQEYYLKTTEKKTYIGDAFWVGTITDPVVLLNPWHAIAIIPIDEARYHVYDPNHATGYCEVSSNELLAVINYMIGTIISVQIPNSSLLPPCQIMDRNAFIADGGLLILGRSINITEIMGELNATRHQPYSKAAFDGLCLRDLCGKPAWLKCMESGDESIKRFIKDLLEQYTTNNDDYVKQLVKSLDALTSAQKGEVITKIVQFFSWDLDSKQELISLIQESSNKMHYANTLETWNKSANMVSSPIEYIKNCLTNEKKRLIELNSTVEVDTLCWRIESQARRSNQAVFYIDNPDNLICSAPYVEKKHDNTGILHIGPGGPFFDFLKANEDNNPLIIVNYERFDSDDMVRFNSLLDEDPKADYTRLPINTRIIGLINRNKPDCYQGSDFYSRFLCGGKIEICPLTSQQLSALKPKRSVEIRQEQSNENSMTVIELFNASDWKERLLGRWVLNGDNLIYSEGELVKAIAARNHIEIQHGLWQDHNFQRFWQQALSSGVQYGDVRIQIPAELNVYRPKVEVYHWDNLIKSLKSIHSGLSAVPKAMTLNPGCLANFLECYELDGNKLIKKPGLLAQMSLDKSLPCVINLTRTLSEDELAILFTEAKSVGVDLAIYCASGVTLPEIFSFTPESNPIQIRGLPQNTSDNMVINSTDPDTTLAMLIKHSKNAIEVIDVSECYASSLLFRLDGRLNDAIYPPCFEFTQTDCAVKIGLAEGKTICLKGRFSQLLLDQLAPLILEIEHSKSNGNLILITEGETQVLFVNNQFQHVVSPEDKLSCLNFPDNIVAQLGSLLEKESLSQLKVRCTFLQLHPTKNSDDAWLGMEHIPSIPRSSGFLFDRKDSVQNCLDFTKVRINQVNEVLQYAPYVFLSGLSGVGKSTFVEKEFCQNDSLHLGEEHLLDWVNDSSPNRKILFLDEANLSQRQWSEFEGLFNTPPRILVDGTLYDISDQHKVIFAGNPVNYGDERTLAPFFKRHGNFVLFDPLPQAVIYEKILKPIFVGMEQSLDPISEQILEMYSELLSYSEKEILISPRELEMIALLTRSRVILDSSLAPNAVAAHFIYALTKQLVPAKNRHAFDLQFKPQDTLSLGVSIPEKGSTFIITPSRKDLSQQLDYLLDLRELRRDEASNLNDKQKFGGLGGIIIEGEPGIGKSKLVISSLVERGYEEEHDLKYPSLKSKAFYCMPVSMSLPEKENLLIKAFNEGSIVIVDEINSAPMMERLLNDLLMGKNPKNTNMNPEKPGFMIVGTQNPITMSGRRALSPALKRRMIISELLEYDLKEISDILDKKGVIKTEASTIISIYEQKRLQAIKENLTPIPNFRNLMALVDDHLTAIQGLKKLHSNLEEVNHKHTTADSEIENSIFAAQTSMYKELQVLTRSVMQAKELQASNDMDGVLQLLKQSNQSEDNLNNKGFDFTIKPLDSLYSQICELRDEIKLIYSETSQKVNLPNK